MQFQPGQSGNPAGRPLGARNKKTLAMEEEIARHAQEAVDIVMRRARGGDPTCLRLLMERVAPTGTNRPLALELPMVRCADDAEAALKMVIEAFGRGAITVREFSPMLGSVDRMARVAERIAQNREREHERYKALRVHGVHPDMLPKPPAEPDRVEAIMAAIDRGEDPFPDDPAKTAYVLYGGDLYPPVNPDAEASSLPRERSECEEGGSPERPAFAPCGSYGGSEVRRSAEREGGSEGEPGGGPLHTTDSELADGAQGDGLYSPVNSEVGAAEQEPAQAAAAMRAEESPGETLAPSLPHERSECGEGGSPEHSEGEPGGGALYSPVNSGASGSGVLPWENRPALDDGSRLVAALHTAGGGREPLYVNPE